MAKLSIISEEDEEQPQPVAAAPAFTQLSIIDEADDIEAPAPVETAPTPVVTALSIVEEAPDPTSPLTTIDVGSGLRGIGVRRSQW